MVLRIEGMVNENTSGSYGGVDLNKIENGINQEKKGRPMKLYHFRELLYASGFFFIFASVFVYGFIWLNHGYDLDDRIVELHKDLSKQIQINNAYNLSANLDLERKIMPSCLIQEAKWKRSK